MLGVLILGAIVANINTSLSNVALPDIGKALNASNQQLTLITDAYQIAIASTVMYLGALGDRHGRKRLLVLGALLAMPFSIPWPVLGVGCRPRRAAAGRSAGRERLTSART